MQGSIDLSLALRGSTNFAGATASVLKYTLHRARKAPSIVPSEFIILRIYRSVQQSLLGRLLSLENGRKKHPTEKPIHLGLRKALSVSYVFDGLVRLGLEWSQSHSHMKRRLNCTGRRGDSIASFAAGQANRTNYHQTRTRKPIGNLPRFRLPPCEATQRTGL
jgi:hypothetical protein